MELADEKQENIQEFHIFKKYFREQNSLIVNI